MPENEPKPDDCILVTVEGVQFLLKRDKSVFGGERFTIIKVTRDTYRTWDNYRLPDPTAEVGKTLLMGDDPEGYHDSCWRYLIQPRINAFGKSR